MLRKSITFCHQLLLLARRCAKSPAQRLHIIRDYCQLYRQKGLTMEEYDEFEFEKRSESFRNDFLGKHEQRHYLQLLNPEKYYILMRNAQQVLYAQNVGKHRHTQGPLVRLLPT